MVRRILLMIFLVVAVGVGGFFAGLFLAGRFAAAPGGAVRTVGGQSAAAAGKKSTAKPRRKILYWWDPMVGPASISPRPGLSSMGMPLIPVYAPISGASVAGQVRVNPAMVQDMGIQTARVTLGPLIHPVRAVGYLRVAAPQRYSITIRAGGWIGKLYATTNGTEVRKGQKLFTLYSPRIVTAEDELVAAQKSLRAARKTAVRAAANDARELVRSVELRLAYLGVSNAQIKQVAKTLRASTYVDFYSPADGVLRDVKVRQKSRLNAGATALRIENFSTLWLDSYVYENQLPWIRMGQRVTATIAAFPGKTFSGKIIFISPYENLYNHTTTIRMVLDNSSHKLRPGMYALADIRTEPVVRTILAPRRAVINTGTGELTFVEISRGHFDPVTVKTGLRGDHGLVQVLSGLGPGQRVVTSGQFMIDVESQLNQIKARFMPKFTLAGKPATAKSAAITEPATKRSRPKSNMKMPPAAKTKGIKGIGPRHDPKNY